MRTIDADHVTSMLHEYVKREQSYIDIGNNRSIAMGHRNGLLEAITQIAEEPTVEPQRMRGRWVGADYDGYADGNPVYYTWKCSVCNCLVEDEEPTWNYCPNCGADMRGDLDETN